MPAPKKFQDPAQFKATKEKVAALVASASTTPSPATPTAPLPATVAAPSPAQPRTRYKREELLASWSQLSGRAMDWLQQGTRFEEMLAETKLKDIAVMLGIATEKVLLLEGQPTQIIAQHQQQKLDQLGQALQAALQQRGLAKSVQLTERTATINLEQKS